MDQECGEAKRATHIKANGDSVNHKAMACILGLMVTLMRASLNSV